MAVIHLVFGPQGAGKSTYARTLAEEVRGIHFAIDEWMWSLFGADLPKSMDVSWIMERVQRCEKRIWKTTVQIVQTGGTVVLDLGFMKRKHREEFIKLAHEQNFTIQLHYIAAPYDLRLKRVLARNAEKGGTYSFEVTPEMFAYMEKEFEPPTDTELNSATTINTK